MKHLFLKIFYGMLAISVIAAVVWGLFPKAVPVDTVEVTRGLIQETVDEDGKTKIKEKFIVSAPLAGRLMRIDLHPGDTVLVGKTLLARIEPTDPGLLDSRQRVAGEAHVKAAEANVKHAGAALDRAQLTLDYAESELARVQKLAEKGFESQEELEESEARYRTGQANYKASKFSQEIAVFELEQARAALLRTDPENNTTEDNPHFEIRSPINGRVLRLFQESATVVQPGVPLLEIGDPLDLEVEIDVLSADAVKIHVGDSVLLQHWGGDEALNGIVRVVEPSAFTKVSALGVEEQRTNVLVDFVDPQSKRQALGDGYRVEARIIIWQGEKILKIPTGALFRHKGKWAVFVIQNGRAELHRVQLGHRNDLYAEVLEGVGEKQLIVLHPSDRIKNGVRVTPR